MRLAGDEGFAVGAFVVLAAHAGAVGVFAGELAGLAHEDQTLKVGAAVKETAIKIFIKFFCALVIGMELVCQIAVSIHIQAVGSSPETQIVEIMVAVGRDVHIGHEYQQRADAGVGNVDEMLGGVHIQAIAGVDHSGVKQRGAHFIHGIHKGGFLNVH